jgi:uncharacterized protein YdeI (YjbR/CyaY-like superfamily)
MIEDKHNPNVDDFMNRVARWQPELVELRRILLASPLTEEVKWRVPCYTFEGKNVAAINGLKEYAALGFFKGALIHDDLGLLQLPGENTREGRLMRFTSVDEIVAQEPVIKAYLLQAIDVEKRGLKLPPSQTEDYPVAEEFQQRLDEDPALGEAFEALTPGRQRGYLLHFAAPKASATRAERVEKAIPRILQGKGLTDR